MPRTVGSVGEQTAAALRDAALTLFAEKGYAAVSMRDLAAAVGVQPGALYNHTSSKQAILVDLLSAHMDALLAAAEAALTTQAAPIQRLAAFTRFHLAYHLPRQTIVFLSYMELRALEPENFAHIEAQRRRYEAILVNILKAGSTSGVFRLRDPRVAAMAIIGMLTGVVNWYRADGRLSFADVEAIYLDLVLQSVGLDADAVTEAA